MGLLQVLTTQQQSKLDQLEALRNVIAERGGDATDAEKANVDVLRAEITKLGEQIANEKEIDELVNRSSSMLEHLPVRTNASPSRGNGRPVSKADGGKNYAEIIRSTWPTPGDYMHDIIHAYQGDNIARANLEHVQRTLADEVTGDVPGLVPEPIVGDVIKVIDASRPVVASLRSYPMPQYGSSFTRPKVTQFTQVGVQATQKTELASRKFLVDPITITKQTLGGSIDVAFQVIDWTSPSALNAIVDDLADQYAIQSEDLAATVLETAAYTTNTANEVDIVAGAEIAAFFTAAGKVYTGCKRLPDTVYASVDMWVYLGSLLDGDDRPLFPMLNPSNAPGQMSGVTTFSGGPLGLRLVVSPALATGSLIVAASQYAEVYEDRRGSLRVVEPKLLGWEIAYYGYFAAAATVPAAFVGMNKPA